MRMRFTVLVIAALALPGTAVANECMALWKERNGIFHQKGYCFSSALGQGYFGTSCYTRDPQLNAAEKARVASILAREQLLQCGSQKGGWTVASLRAADVPTQPAVVPAQPAVPTVTPVQIIEMQTLLTQLGYYTGAIDGVWNNAVQQSAGQFLSAVGSGPLTVPQLLDQLRAQGARLAQAPQGTVSTKGAGQVPGFYQDDAQGPSARSVMDLISSMQDYARGPTGRGPAEGQHGR